MKLKKGLNKIGDLQIGIGTAGETMGMLLGEFKYGYVIYLRLQDCAVTIPEAKKKASKRLKEALSKIQKELGEAPTKTGDM